MNNDFMNPYLSMQNWMGSPSMSMPSMVSRMPESVSLPMVNTALPQIAPMSLWGQAKGLAQDSGFVGYTDKNGNRVDGWGGTALDAFKAIGGLYSAYKMNKLGNEQLQFQRKAFDTNFDAQRRTTNAALEDRQKRRYAENPGFYESPTSYMAKWGVK